MARVLMATQPWGVIQRRDVNGVVSASAAKTVHMANTDGSAATTWTAQTGGSSTTADTVTDSNGAMPNWIEEGEYDQTIDGVTKRVEAHHSYRHPVAYFGNATDGEYAAAPTQFQVVQYFGQSGTVSGLLPQAALTRAKWFDTTVDDSMQADASQSIFTNSGTPKTAQKPIVANESDVIVQAGNIATGYTSRAIGHIDSVEAQTSGSTIDFAYAHSVAAKSAKDTGSLIRQHAAYHSEDQTAGISGKVGAAWSILVPKNIHSRDSISIADWTGVEGHLNAAVSIGGSSVTLEAGHGAGGFRGTSAFANGNVIQIDVGANAEIRTISTVSTDTLNLTSNLSKAHAQYARVAVLGANSYGMLYMSSANLRTDSVFQATGFTGLNYVYTAANGAGFYQMQAQTSGTVGTPSAATSRLYQNGQKVLSYKHEDGAEAPVYTGHRRVLNTNTVLTALDVGIIARTSTASAATFTLPAANAAPAGALFIFKDEAGDAGTNNITVSRAGSDDFEGGVTTKVINTNFGVLRVYTGGGTRWFFA